MLPLQSKKMTGVSSAYLLSASLLYLPGGIIRERIQVDTAALGVTHYHLKEGETAIECWGYALLHWILLGRCGTGQYELIETSDLSDTSSSYKR